MSCPTCQSEHSTLFARVKDWEYFTVPEEFTYLECSGCMTIYLPSPPVDRLNIIYPSNYYSGSTSQTKSLVFKIKEYLDIRMFKKLLSNIQGETLSILDIGGGDGWVLNSVKKADKRITNTAIVDLNANAKENAEKEGHTFFNQTVENFHTDRKFDLILMLNLIEHVADPGLVLSKLKDRLTPNGRIFIKTPNTKTLDQKLFKNSYWGGLHCPRHWVLFTKKNFTDLAHRSGLVVEQFYYTQGAPQWAMSILALLARKGWIKANAKKPLLDHFLAGPLLGLAAAFDFIRMPLMATAQMCFVLKKK